MNFDEAFDRLIGHEGGYSTDRNDPGNWTGGRVGVGALKGTKYGIAANTYPDIDIQNLTLPRAKEIYRRDWWDKIAGDDLPGAVTAQVWDFAVNAGMSTAKRALQRAVGAADDGIFGPVTIARIKQADLSDVLMRFNAQRLNYYTALSGWATYGKGWTRRVAGQLEYSAQDN